MPTLVDVPAESALVPGALGDALDPPVLDGGDIRLALLGPVAEFQEDLLGLRDQAGSANFPWPILLSI